MKRANLTIVIPTYGRERVLVETLRAVTGLAPAAAEVIVVDQTPTHKPETAEMLSAWELAGAIRWMHRPQPSIPQAMNAGLDAAASELVLFLDDDIVPAAGLIAAHAQAHAQFPDAWAVVGQVLQPGQVALDVAVTCVRDGLRADLEFPFFRTRPDEVQNVMAGNLSVKRQPALAVGGFDENFVGVAYRFETEFARRLIRAGGRIHYCPEASIWHLRASRGGTRAQGSHLTSADPIHGVGDYYFAMLQGRNADTRRYMARRMIREVCTRFHLKHPWWIPVKLVGEIRAWLWARRLAKQQGAGSREQGVGSRERGMNEVGVTLD